MLLLALAVARADPLWVEGPSIPLVQAAVQALWPDGPLEVVARPEQITGEGLLWVGGQLIWIREGRAWTAEAPDAATAVLVARSWLREPIARVGEVPPPPPVPVAPVAVVPPPGLDYTVSAGLRFLDRLDGIRVGGGVIASHLEASATLFLSTRDAVAPSSLEDALPADAAGHLLEPRDQIALALGGTWVPGRVRPAATASGGPVALAGGEVSQQVVRHLTATEQVGFDATSRIDVSGFFGVGADVWTGRRFGVLGSVVDRVGYRPLPGLGQRIQQQVILALDVRLAVP